MVKYTSMEKAIVIENRKKEAADYKAALDAMGFETEVAYSGGIGSKYMHETNYAFALIDHKLPDMTGCDLIREVRRDGITTPILGMSRHVGSAERTQALRLGADGYITKPFDIDELQAYVNAMLRRTNREETHILQHRSITVNKVERTAFGGTTDLNIKGQLFDLLVLLMENRGRYVSTRKILRTICPGARTIKSDAVKVAKNRLSEKLAACGERDFITTKNGLGYAIF